MSSFNGKIWGIPTKEGPTMSYSDAQKRPFYIIVIGNQKHINKIKKNLEEQHFVDGDEKYKFALITSSPVLPKQSQKKLINEDSLDKLAKAEKFKFQYLKDMDKRSEEQLERAREIDEGYNMTVNHLENHPMWDKMFGSTEKANDSDDDDD